MTIIINGVIGPFVTVGILFGSITLGQLFSKARVLMAILCYLGVIIVNNLISSAVQSIATFSTLEIGTMMNISTYSTLVVQLIVAVLLYFASYHIITKRLNME